MIFVTLGTQDKSFERLLEAIDKLDLDEEIIVQAGSTKYSSSKMKIFDYVSGEDFEKYIDKADIVITHGGIAAITSALKHNKKVIAAARLSKYGEHHNDHQKQIINEFVKDGYILELSNFNELDKLIKKARVFKPTKYQSNNKKMIKLISDYIDNSNHKSWYNRFGIILWIIIIILILLIVCK